MSGSALRRARWAGRASLPGLPWLALLTLSIAFRAPFLINASGTNSDAAVVGLQAMHLLRGEWSPFLWGSGYQTSADSLVAAALFAVTGPSPLALAASTLAEHILLTWFVFDMVRDALGGDLGERLAAVACLPLVLTPDPVHTYVLYPPRQAALTLAFAALWVAHRARGSPVRGAAGGVLASLAVLADPYALLLVPSQGLHAILSARDDAPRGREWARRFAVWAGAALVGALPYLALRRAPGASLGQTSLSLDVVTHNLALLVGSCGPWILSTRVFAAEHMSDYAPWDAGAAFHLVQIAGGVIFVAGFVAALALARSPSLPWRARRLGVVGAATAIVTVGGFLVSPMVMDHFSSRYLAALVLASPLAFAPAAGWLGGRLGDRFAALALAPYLVSAAVGGWVSFRPFGLERHASLTLDHRLGVALRERDVRYAVADYWASYRLTFVFRESPIVVPTNLGEDRYRPYRDAFEREPRVAYIYDALRSRESLPEVEARIQGGQAPFEPRYDRLEIGSFTVLLLTRRAAPDRVADLARP